MAEALSNYHSPSNAGRAQIFSNQLLPIQVLSQNIERKRIADAQQAQLEQQRQREAASSLQKLLSTDMGNFWDRDYQTISEPLNAVREKASQYLQQGITPTDMFRHPKEYAEIMKGIQDANSRFKMSNQQHEQYKKVLESLSKDNDGLYDQELAKAELEKYAGLSPEERANQVLALDKFYNVGGIAGTLLKDFKPEQNSTYQKDGKGGVISKEFRTFSPEQMGNMANQLLEDNRIKSAFRNEYSRLDEAQQMEAGGLEGFMNTRAKEIAERFQINEAKEKFGVDSGYWNSLRLNEQRRQFNEKQATKTGVATEADITKRVSLIDEIAKGGEAAIRGLSNSASAGKKVKAAKKTIVGNKPMLELELNLTPKEIEDGASKTVQIDMSSPGWQWEVNNLLNTLTGTKTKIQQEEMRDYLIKKKRWGYGAESGKKETEDALGLFEEAPTTNEDDVLGIN